MRGRKFSFFVVVTVVKLQKFQKLCWRNSFWQKEESTLAFCVGHSKIPDGYTLPNFFAQLQFSVWAMETTNKASCTLQTPLSKSYQNKKQCPTIKGGCRLRSQQQPFVNPSAMSKENSFPVGGPSPLCDTIRCKWKWTKGQNKFPSTQWTVDQLQSQAKAYHQNPPLCLTAITEITLHATRSFAETDWLTSALIFRHLALDSCPFPVSSRENSEQSLPSFAVAFSVRKAKSPFVFANVGGGGGIRERSWLSAEREILIELLPASSVFCQRSAKKLSC